MPLSKQASDHNEFCKVRSQPNVFHMAGNWSSKLCSQSLVCLHQKMGEGSFRVH